MISSSFEECKEWRIHKKKRMAFTIFCSLIFFDRFKFSILNLTIKIEQEFLKFISNVYFKCDIAFHSITKIKKYI